ncbi:hypothetical protein BDN72DRAFT_904688 [Pluteus cervinus]|uniref:Uncharacterized protein n=1 Tax=Pluteus cervinus TaxID=181527 RepID=A0ACD3A598_9AGAR|nr:hypothetical protein BDN72DRAFT_904688 [Pluteus cervinus]
MDDIVTILERPITLSGRAYVLCRYDITLIYEGQRNTPATAHIQQAVIFARLLLGDGKPIQDVERSQLIVNEGATSRIQWKLGGFFLVRPTASSFAIYVGFKSSEQEQTILEAKFYQSIPSLWGSYTRDIVASRFLDDGFSLSLDTHHFNPNTHGRVDISHEAKNGSTSFNTNPFSDGCSASLEKEKRLIQSLLDLPASDARAAVLFHNGNHLILRNRHTSDLIYFDLAIQAMSAARAYWQGLRGLETQFCHLLFIRCTFPDFHPFLDKAIDVLKGLDGLSLAEEALDQIDFLGTVLQVLREQNRTDYAAIALPILTPSFRVLANVEHPERNERVIAALKLALYLSIRMPPTVEILEIVDINLPLVRPDEHGSLLIYRALVYLGHYKVRGEPEYDTVVEVIDKARVYALGHRNLGVERNLLSTFLYESISFLLEPGSHQEDTRYEIRLAVMKMTISCQWIACEALDGHTRSMLMNWALCLFACLLPAGMWETAAPVNRNQAIKEYIQAVYFGSVLLEDGDVEFLVQLISYQTKESMSFHASRNGDLKDKIHTLVEVALSAEPPDEMSLMQVIIAAPAARFFRLPVTLKAYEFFMSAPDLWVSLATPLKLRYASTITLTSIVSDAISYVLGLGCPDVALEWADQRSSIIWGQVLYFHSSFTEVATVSSGLAKELTESACEMLRSQAHRELSYNYGHAKRWEDAVRETRKLPGLNRFLRPKTSKEVQAASQALGGPVVYFNLNCHSCDALCVLPNLDDVIHIPLPGLEALDIMYVLFIHFLERTGTEEIQLDRVGKMVKIPNTSIPRQFYLSLTSVLKFLWDQVVKPILDGLAIQRSVLGSADKLPRIWWCPSGQLALFPLHAAGYYSNPTDENILDYVVSSYIPSALVATQATRAEDTPPPFHFLGVANPEGCGLPGTKRDLDIIRKHAAHRPLTELVGKYATPEIVKQELKKATWAHFACHGTQNQSPAETSLILANHNRLTLLDISKLSMPQAQLAFLAACQTGKADFQTSGESAHISGGMLVAGFRGVIGTMWNISDYYAPDFADRFYQKMFEGSRTPDYKRAAYALHDTVKTLRMEKDLDPRIWVPFMHYGA